MHVVQDLILAEETEVMEFLLKISIIVLLAIEDEFGHETYIFNECFDSFHAELATVLADNLQSFPSIRERRYM